MELVDSLRGKRICIDTAPFIYFIEKDPKYLNTVRPIFSEIDAGNIEALTSTITLLEVLVLPFRTKNESLAEKYRDILLHAEGLETYEIVHEVSELAAKLRVKYAILTPDAIQIAVGIIYGADAFLTNDSGLKKVDDIRVVILEEFARK
jgi:predicted nucleic acid-binding protein